MTKKISHRLKIINGQINSLIETIETTTDCETVFHQLNSIKAALKSCSATIVKKYIADCLKKKDKNIEKIVDYSVKLLS